MRSYHCKAFRLESRIADAQGVEVAQILAGQSGLCHEIKITTPNAYPVDYTIDSSISIGTAIVLYALAAANTAQAISQLFGVDANRPGIARPALSVGQQTGPVRFSIDKIQYPSGWGGSHNHNLAVQLDLLVR